MFFCGTKLKTIKTGIITNAHCDYCDEESDMEYDFQQKYFHLYFIPCIPLKKKTSVCCQNCFEIIEEKHFSNGINVKLNRVKERYPIQTPIWSFSGLILLSLLTCWAFWQSGRHDVVEDNYIKSPKKGDIYWIEYHPKEYTTLYSTLKVDKVDKQNVYFTYNDTSVTKYTKIFSILDDKHYTNQKGIYTRQKIKDLFKKDSIISITRKE
ncbi:MAG: zinc-ribbon domain-containing protein [Bacteroidota bacterium]